MDTSTLTFVDKFAGKIEALAAEMSAANFCDIYRTGAPSILRDMATDLKLQVRELERVPTGIRVERIDAFSPRHLQASGERSDVAEPIRKLFAAASVPLPAKGSTVTPATVDLVLAKSNVDVVDRMKLKSQMEAAGSSPTVTRRCAPSPEKKRRNS